MPKKFTDCVKNGGRMMTKSLPKGQYIHGCKPKGGGDVIWGEIKKKQKRYV